MNKIKLNNLSLTRELAAYLITNLLTTTYLSAK